jgi:hypothetical protein
MFSFFTSWKSHLPSVKTVPHTPFTEILADVSLADFGSLVHQSGMKTQE